MEDVSGTYVYEESPQRLEIEFDNGGVLVIPWHLIKAYAVQP